MPCFNNALCSNLLKGQVNWAGWGWECARALSWSGILSKWLPPMPSAAGAVDCTYPEINKRSNKQTINYIHTAKSLTLSFISKYIKQAYRINILIRISLLWHLNLLLKSSWKQSKMWVGMHAWWRQNPCIYQLQGYHKHFEDLSNIHYTNIFGSLDERIKIIKTIIEIDHARTLLHCHKVQLYWWIFLFIFLFIQIP